MIGEAVLLCKEVAGKLCLEILVSHLVAVHAYVAVVEICLVRDIKSAFVSIYDNPFMFPIINKQNVSNLQK